MTRLPVGAAPAQAQVQSPASGWRSTPRRSAAGEAAGPRSHTPPRRPRQPPEHRLARSRSPAMPSRPPGPAPALRALVPAGLGWLSEGSSKRCGFRGLRGAAPRGCSAGHVSPSSVVILLRFGVAPARGRGSRGRVWAVPCPLAASRAPARAAGAWPGLSPASVGSAGARRGRARGKAVAPAHRSTRVLQQTNGEL